VFGFGLIHGLGLATRFQALGVPKNGQLWKVIAFNVGIEIGQLTAIVAVLGAAAVLSMTFGRVREPVLAKSASAGLFLVGAVAAPLLAYQGFTTVDPASADVTNVALPNGCTVGERTETFPAAGGQHTAKRFYAPGEHVPRSNFGHSLGDGYIIVLYPGDLPADQLESLRAFVEGHPSRGVLAGSDNHTSGKVKAVTVAETMTCNEVHMGALQQFSAAWFDSLGMSA
jgi:hypothetical protein